MQRESVDYEHWIGEHKLTVYIPKTTDTFKKDTPVPWDADLVTYLKECYQVAGILNKDIF